MQRTKSSKKERFEKLSLIAGLVLFCIILIVTIISLKTTGQCYSELKNTDLSRGIESTLYYDEGKNAVILNGTEYPPEIVGNPEHYTGVVRAGAFLFELINAYSGNGLLMTDSIIDGPVPIWAEIAYAVKAVMWCFLSSRFIKRRRTRQPH